MPLEIERKWLLAGAPDPAVLEQASGSEITQVYLSGDPPGSTRVRRRTSDSGTVHTRTRKTEVAPGVREEVEEEISASQYDNALAQADPDRAAIRKRRYVIDYAGRRFELDELLEPVSAWLLELELSSSDDLVADVDLPSGLVVEREVTGDRAWTNSELARRR